MPRWRSASRSTTRGSSIEAEASYRRVLAIEPGYAEVHSNLGHVLGSLGRLEEAEASYRRALEIKPAYVKAVRGLGDVLHMQGRLEDAVATFRQALAIDPGAAAVHNDLGNVLQQLGLPEEALASYEARSRSIRASSRRTAMPGAPSCGSGASARPSPASARQSRSSPISPKRTSTSAMRCRDGGTAGEAIASYRRALAIKPDLAIAHVALGDLQKNSGLLGDAQASFGSALAIDPEFHDAHSSLLFCMSHDESVESDALFAEHRRFGDRVEQPLRAGWPVHRNARDPERACASASCPATCERTRSPTSSSRCCSIWPDSNRCRCTPTAITPATTPSHRRLRPALPALALGRGAVGRTTWRRSCRTTRSTS